MANIPGMMSEVAISKSLGPTSVLRNVAWLAVWAYFVSVPLEFSITLPEPLESFARLFIVIAILTGLTSAAVTGSARRWRFVHWFVLLYLVLVSLSLLWSLTPTEEAERSLRQYFQIAPIVLLSWEFVRDREQRTQILVAYLLGGLISSWLTLRDALFLHKAWYANFRYTVGAWNPNELAIIFAVGLPLAFYLTLDRSLQISRLQASISWLYIIFGSIGILLTGSREGIIVGAFAFGAIPFLVSKSSRSKLYIFLAVFTVLLCAGLFLVPSGTWRIFSTVGTQVRTGDLDQRVQIWRFGWLAFLRTPFFGSGIGSFRWASGSLYNAHNTYLEVSVEQGIVGLLIILGLIVGALARLRHAARAERVAGTFCLLTWALAATVDHMEELRVTWVVFALAFLFGCDRSIRESEPDLEPSHNLETRVVPRPGLLDASGQTNGRIHDRPAES